MAPSAFPASKEAEKFSFDDDDGWQDMPIIREDEFANGLDEEDKKKYHYVASSRKNRENGGAGNATGNLIDFDDRGNEWREKQDANESEYTRLRLNEEEDADEVHLRTRYLFDEDKAMTPLSQMQATKNLLTEAQRIAYVGLCALTSREMLMAMRLVKSKELKSAIDNMELWELKIMGRLYYHMELATQEQKMIESLSEHGVQSTDLVPSLMTTHTVANPEYDPIEAQKQATARDEAEKECAKQPETQFARTSLSVPPSPSHPPGLSPPTTPKFQTTVNVLAPSSPVSVPGVSTSLSSADERVTLDIRWTVLCDLFLLLIADSVYDARSRVLLEAVAMKLGLGWLDVVKFEQRVTEALEIQESVEKLEQKEVIEGRTKANRNRRYAMMGLATLGGGLVIGLSAGLLAPVIGAGLGAAFATIGVTGTTGFLAGAGGAAVITTAGTLTGSGIAARGMARRTQQVRTFDLLPLHNNKRVNCIVTVSGFMTSSRDDVRLPFSVLDPIVGDVFSVLWEPEMLGETGSALKLLTGEVLSQVSTTVLQATVMTALMSALQWPILLTKLGYLIDNPWSNALDRAKAAGSVLADVLIQRHLGVRPIILIGFSLGARMIFYCLLELAKQKAFGIVQDVFILGTTVTASRQSWLQARGVVSGRFVNGYARNDWVLNYLFRATSAGLNNIAGLRPVQNVPGLENVDVTDKIAGHMSYRTYMPLILDQLGFPVASDYFDEPEEPDMTQDRMVVREGEELPKKKRRWFSRKSTKAATTSASASRTPPEAPSSHNNSSRNSISSNDEIPERLKSLPSSPLRSPSPSATPQPTEANDSQQSLPLHAGFDLQAIKEVIVKENPNLDEVHAPMPHRFETPILPPPSMRSESAPPPISDDSSSRSVTPVQRPSLDLPNADQAVLGSKHSLTAAFSRSLSVSDVSDGEGEIGSTGGQRVFEEDIPRYASGSSPGRIPPAPTLSFGGSDGSVWSSDPPPINIFDKYRASASTTDGDPYLPYPRNRPGDASTLSFGTSDGSVWAPNVPPKEPATSLGHIGNGHHNSTFGKTSPETLKYSGNEGSHTLLPSRPFELSSPSLSFGGPDGMVSPSTTSEDRDPWRPPPLGTAAKPASFNSNPWQ